MTKTRKQNSQRSILILFDLDFDYKTIDITKDLFAGEATVWASGCKLKQRDEKNEDIHYEVTLVSAEGEELSSESFEKVRGDFNSVQDGGLLVKTADGLKYIDETGKSQAISDDFNFDDIYFQNSQLLDGKIYIPVGWDGIYAVDVK